MSQRPDPKFFAELTHRIKGGESLAQQNRFADARAAFSSVLDFAAESGVNVPVSLLLDTWTNLFWCALGLDDFERAEKYLRAAEAFLLEFDENQRAGRYKQGNPTNNAFALVRELIPPKLQFVVPQNFDPGNDLKRVNYQRQFLDPRLDTLDHVMRTLYDFAGFYCGLQTGSGEQSNWYVKKDWLTFFSHKGYEERFEAGILAINAASPYCDIEVALTEQGCRVLIGAEFPVKGVDSHIGFRVLREGTIKADRLALWAFLNQWVKDGVIIPSGDRFKLGVE